MAYTTLATVSWGTGPKIPITFYYDRQRSGADMQYKIKVVVGTVTGSSYFGYPIYTTISLDGTAKVSGHTLKSASPSQWSSGITYETGWLTVSGKTTGTTALTIRLYSGSGSTRNTSYTYSLAVSPAATTPTLSASSIALGSSVTINTPRASSSFTHTLKYKFGSSTGTIATSVATYKSWTPPLSLASQIPNAASGSCTITCETYNGSTLIGTKTVNLTLTVPASVVPTISAVDIAEATSGLAEQFAAYVQNKSTLAVTITAAGVYSSKITKYETTVLGVKYTGARFTSQVLTATGSVSVAVTVTDSRGRTTTQTSTITVLEYFAPLINSMSVYRIDTSGNADDEGTRIAVTMDFEIAEVGTRNNRTFSLQYKKSGDPDTSFSVFSSGTASWTYSGTQTFTSSPELSTDYAYVIRLIITDYFGSVQQDFDVPTAFVIMDFRNTGKGMAIGKVSEQDAFEVAMQTKFTDTVDMDIPLPVESGGTGSAVRRTSFEPTSTIVTNLTYTAYYYPFLGMCFVRMYFSLNSALTAGTLRNVIAIPEGFRPGYRHALSIHTGASASAEAVVASDGLISMRSNIDLTTSNSIYITGFWFL